MGASRIYISGGITGVRNYKARFYDAQNQLESRYDCIVVNPVMLGTKVESVVDSPQWHHYMRECVKWLAMCDKVFMLRGWWRSRGARVEWMLAKILRIDVMYQHEGEPYVREAEADEASA